MRISGNISTSTCLKKMACYNVYLCLYHYVHLWMCWCSMSWLFVTYTNKYKVSVCTYLDAYHCVSGDCFCALVYFMCLMWQRICATSVRLIPGNWAQSGNIRASKSECVDVYGLLCGTYLHIYGYVECQNNLPYVLVRVSLTILVIFMNVLVFFWGVLLNLFI